jgi:micrococcal nuclease
MTFPILACKGPRALWSAVVVLWATPGLAGDVSGRVSRVLDGDTLEVLHNQHPEHIRLSGIDCPEKGQAFGHDKYRRSNADVLLPDGMNLNQELVKQGWCWCWWYRKYAPGNTVLERLEHKAREARKGLWVTCIPFRRGSGGRGKSVSRQTLLLGGASLGFCLRRSQQDANGGAK